MGPIAIALILASVVLHVGWNAVAKGRPSLAFFFVGCLIGSTALLPVLFLHAGSLVGVLAAIWPILVATGIAQTVYGFSLARAYRVEDLSVVYPLVRSLGPVFVVAGSLVLGRGDAISLACIAGVVAILLGSVALTLGNLRIQGLRAIRGAGIAFSIVAALGTAGYTLLDDVGVHWVHESGTLDALANAPLHSGLLYVSLEAWATTLIMGLWLARKREHRQALREYTSRAELRDAALMGIGSQASYALVLIAMLYVDDVSYVAGFRQLSVPVGAAVGVMWFKERLDSSKALGLLAMLIGLLLIASG